MLAVTLVAATEVSAVTVLVRQPSPGYGGGHGGGEFNISPDFTGGTYGPDVAIFGGFETFCIQANVNIIVPGTYDAALSQQDGGGTPLSKGAAWLYQMFASENPVLVYDYTPGVPRTGSADELQQAIWILQGQGGPNVVETAATSAYVQLAAANFGSLANALAPNNGALPVSIVILVGTNGVPGQNMLVLFNPPSCKASLCGTIFADCDGSGDLTSVDVGLNGVPVKVVDSTGKTVGSVNTGTNGGYCFGGLDAGTYTVVVTPPAGYKQTAASSACHWKDSYGRDCWKENDDSVHCKDNGSEYWQGKDGCVHWKDNSGNDCWKDKNNGSHSQSCNYKPCNAPTNNNTLTVTLTNCENKVSVNFAYTGTKPNMAVCVAGPSWVKCGQTVTYSCSVTNTGNVCLKAGKVCHTIGNYDNCGWQGTPCQITIDCPSLRPGEGCVVKQDCVVGWSGIVGCISKAKYSHHDGDYEDQSGCGTVVSWW